MDVAASQACGVVLSRLKPLLQKAGDALPGARCALYLDTMPVGQAPRAPQQRNKLYTASMLFVSIAIREPPAARRYAPTPSGDTR